MTTSLVAITPPPRWRARTVFLLAGLLCAGCPGATPPLPPPVDGQFSKPVSLGAEARFDSSGAAVITITSELAAELSHAPGGSPTAAKVPLTREGSDWKGRIENLPLNDQGTLVVELGEGESRPILLLEWSFATVLDGLPSGVHSADGMLEFEVKPLVLAPGTRLSVLSRPATMIGRKRVMGPYQLVANANVRGRGVFSLPSEPTEGWSRWNFATAQVLRSIDGQPFAPVAAVAHPELGRFTFSADAPASYVLAIELGAKP
jgi:hypothetical protein